MKYSVAAAILATGAMATKNHTVPVVTETVSSIVTYCPGPTTFTHGSSTYTVTEPTTLTITDCPCTITKPVIPTSSVECYDCPPETEIPAPPPAPTNGTIPGVPQPTGGVPVPPPTEGEPEQPAPTGAASKATFGLAGLVGLAAFFL